MQGSRFGFALFVIPANAGIQKAQITTMVNPVQTFPDWIPAFAGMTGCGLSESDKNSGNGYKSFIELFHAKGLDFKKGFSEVEIVSE